ncbi:proline-rich family protein [Trema orientale]|uniref:Proline-rich family protein n=1 Tax=Trema orientale TaxID=63057 RepID=A0A2P5EAP3_TREOI|nr:proline-rich family protein [Trema orientale]
MAIDPNSTTSSATASTAPAATTTAAAPTLSAATATNAARPFTNPPPSGPISPLHQPQLLHPHPHHPTTTTAAAAASFSAQQPLYTAHPLPIRTPVPPYPNSQLVKSPADPSSPAHGIPYPVASSGRGFIPKAVRPDQTVTVANPGGYPPRPVVAAGFHHAGGVRSHLECLNVNHHPPHPPHGHMVRPLQNLQQHLYHPHLGSAVGPIKGVPVSVQSKVTPPSLVPDCNGHKDMRDKSRDDTLTMIRDRKVRVIEGASLYSLCRSWLRNGIPEETQVCVA